MSSSSDNKSLFSFAGTAVPGEAATASSAGDDDVVNYEETVVTQEPSAKGRLVEQPQRQQQQCGSSAGADAQLDMLLNAHALACGESQRGLERSGEPVLRISIAGTSGSGTNPGGQRSTSSAGDLAVRSDRESVPSIPTPGKTEAARGQGSRGDDSSVAPAPAGPHTAQGAGGQDSRHDAGAWQTDVARSLPLVGGRGLECHTQRASGQWLGRQTLRKWSCNRW